jgi:hypothetical protein
MSSRAVMQVAVDLERARDVFGFISMSRVLWHAILLGMAESRINMYMRNAVTSRIRGTKRKWYTSTVTCCLHVWWWRINVRRAWFGTILGTPSALLYLDVNQRLPNVPRFNGA